MKINILTLIFVISCIIAFVPYDIANFAIANISAIIALWFAMKLKVKWQKVLLFFLTAIFLMQILVSVRDCLWFNGLDSFFKTKTMGVVVGDFLYGIKYSIVAVYDLFYGCYKAIRYNDFMSLESLNSRFILTVVWIIILIPYILIKNEK